MSAPESTLHCSWCERSVADCYAAPCYGRYLASVATFVGVDPAGPGEDRTVTRLATSLGLCACDVCLEKYESMGK